MDSREFNLTMAELRRRIDELPRSRERERLFESYADVEARYFQIRSNGERAQPTLRAFDESLANLKAATHLLEDRGQDLRLRAKMLLFAMETRAREQAEGSS